MAGLVAVLPILEAVEVSCPVYVVHGLVIVNGLCCGFALAATDKMVLLFPGGKSYLLFRWGPGQFKDRQTDRQTDRRRDRQTDRLTDRRTDRQISIVGD